jgi:outer membrane lipoprotein-sorting protein
VKIRVWISKNDGLPRMISVPDEGDLLIILRNIKTNVAISDSRFQWSPPPGMKTKNIFGF